MKRRNSIIQFGTVLYYCHNSNTPCENANFAGYCTLSACDRMAGDEECEHDKVYDTRTAYLTYPAQYDWICRKCGKRGCGFIGRIEESEYERISREFDEGETSQC